MQTCPSSSLSLCISKSCSLVENTPLLMVFPHLLCQECSTPCRGIRWRLLCLLSGISFQVSSSEKPSWTHLTWPRHSVMYCVCLSSICRCWNNSVYWFICDLSLSFFLSRYPTRMSAPWKQGPRPILTAFNKSHSCPIIAFSCLNHQVTGWTVSPRKTHMLKP